MSQPRPTAIVASVGTPFDRVWPPTTPGHLQLIFSYIDSQAPTLEFLDEEDQEARRVIV